MSTWYLGPLGDLRPLICPERDITISEVRYGGIHQGLSGARTMDITGHRSEFSFEFKYLDQAEWQWLEALHSRLVIGPHWLINPMKRNRLSLQSSRLTVSRFDKSGVRLPTGAFQGVSPAFPVSAKLPGRSVYFREWTDVAPRITFDPGKFIPVMPGETISASVWLTTEAGKTYPSQVTLQLDWFDRLGAVLEPTVSPAFGLTGRPLDEEQQTGWTHHFLQNITPPARAAACRFSIGLGDPVAAVFVHAPQVEAGPVITDFEVGCAAPEVLVDQVPTVSPRFPLRNATLTLLEA